MTDGEHKRAMFWVRRWRAVGGGFWKDGPDAEITIVRRVQDDEKIEAIYSKTAQALEDELHGNRQKKRDVLTLAACAYDVKTLADTQEPEQDNGAYCCERHGYIDDGSDDAA